eukprot:TRINITY_DN8334_c0_g2_i2.p1 TRINITY_DN8334_c0_g2~~TRINITY_DN8334_c0_g2_i2.p1  ORF type:complete len:313 (+),score=56.19 TRINITY_DN8334_c0_g2_i2:660-1598(+)
MCLVIVWRNKPKRKMLAHDGEDEMPWGALLNYHYTWKHSRLKRPGLFFFPFLISSFLYAMDISQLNRDNTIILFDVDGTLSKPRLSASAEMLETLIAVRQKYQIGVVGGSDISKQMEQLGGDCLARFDYFFSENGLLAFRDGQQFHKESFKSFLGEDRLKTFINFCLHYIADLDIPIKRGTFIEFRNGMLNVSPIGRNCSQSEREEFEQYDLKHNIRPTMIKALEERFGDFKLKYSIGGQISFDVFPIGWDKTYCLQHLPTETFKHVFFFGDKTMPGGNDREISMHPRVEKAFPVVNPDDTLRILKDTFLKQ